LIWDDAWRALVPPGTPRIDVPRSPSARRALQSAIRARPPGTVLALVGVGTRARWRRFAAGAGLSLDEEYLVFPSLQGPHYLVRDAPPAIAYFCASLLTTPPGSAPASALRGALIWLLSRIAPCGLVGSLAPVRVSVGRRT